MSDRPLSCHERELLVRWALNLNRTANARLLLIRLALKADANYSVLIERVELRRDAGMLEPKFMKSLCELKRAGDVTAVVERHGLSSGRGKRHPFRYTLHPHPAEYVRPDFSNVCTVIAATAGIPSLSVSP